MPDSRPLTEFDFELLSAYIDGQLSDSERQLIETRLADEPSLSAALDDSRATVALIKLLPPTQAPRNYTLTPQMVSARSQPAHRVVPFAKTSVFSALSTAAAVVLLVIGVSFLTQSSDQENANVAMLATSITAQPFEEAQSNARAANTALAAPAEPTRPISATNIAEVDSLALTDAAQLIAPTQTQIAAIAEQAAAESLAAGSAMQALAAPTMTEGLLFSTESEGTLSPDLFLMPPLGDAAPDDAGSVQDQVEGAGGGTDNENAFESAPSIAQSAAMTETPTTTPSSTATSTKTMTPTVAPTQTRPPQVAPLSTDDTTRTAGLVLIGVAIVLFTVAGVTTWKRRSSARQ